jgi:hypothetical protein
MSCKAAKFEPEDGRYTCDVTGDGCIWLIPNSKRCVEVYGEGPDAEDNESEVIPSDND